MAINRLYIDNFKGIGSRKWIDIKPITIFIGANSSGKSSCIHALICLSQTLKVPNNTAPIVIDDEYASVHLGRFIEVIHSKSYQDTISLGLTTSEIPALQRLSTVIKGW
ncbi:MAG: AAA family ATPase [Mariprofundaceae bacterium]|nr:AAA family ATPase [Mariprofundaceae bacterium]